MENRTIDLNVRTCCICGKKFVGRGNDPRPVKRFEDGECCERCFFNFVAAARYEIANAVKECDRQDRQAQVQRRSPL